MKKTAKKPAKRPLVRKVEAAHRLREGKQKKARLKPHVEEDARPPDFTPPEAVGEGRPLTDAYNECLRDRQEQSESIGRLVQAAKGYPPETGPVVMEYHWGQSRPSPNNSTMAEHILTMRSLKEMEIFVFETMGAAYPRLRREKRRAHLVNVIAGSALLGEPKTMAWLLATSPVNLA